MRGIILIAVGEREGKAALLLEAFMGTAISEHVGVNK
jgi:hypothetical protein